MKLFCNKLALNLNSINMKNFYTLLFVTFIFCSPAQTLTQSFNEPVIGDIDRSNRLDTSAYTSGLPTSVIGNNCAWDFTKLVGIFPMVIDSFITPAAAQNGSAFPTASYAQNRDKIYSFYKSSTSPAQTELLGGYTPSLSLTFTNSAVIAGYPVSYGYNLSDPVSGSFKYNSTNGACNGNITITADGIGTLNLANGISIPNVLRLKSVEILTLSTSFIPVGSFNQTIYNYYMPGKKFPVVNINYTTYQLLAGTPTITALVYGNKDYFGIVGLEENNSNAAQYQVYPNPFQSTFNISKQLNNLEYFVYNLEGRLLIQTKSNESTEFSNLQKGIYFLEIKDGDKLHRQKIVKD